MVHHIYDASNGSTGKPPKNLVQKCLEGDWHYLSGILFPANV